MSVGLPLRILDLSLEDLVYPLYPLLLYVIMTLIFIYIMFLYLIILVYYKYVYDDIVVFFKHMHTDHRALGFKSMRLGSRLLCKHSVRQSCACGCTLHF